MRWILIAGLLCSCGGRTPQPQSGRNVARPGWVHRPNTSHPKLVYLVGHCRDAANRAKGRQCAIRDGRAQLRRRFEGAPKQVVGERVDKDYFEPKGSAFDVWVLLAYPRSAYQRAQIKAANQLLLGVRCKAEAGCGTVVDQVDAALTEAGFKPFPKRLPVATMADSDEVLRHAKKTSAAKVVLAVIDAKFKSSSDGEYYAEAHCTARLIDSVDGKLIQAFNSGPVKGGHIGRAQAVDRAVKNCVKRMRGALAKWSP